MTIVNNLFEEFLTRLEPDISSTAERYSCLRAKLIKFFEWRHCHDREGLTDETISRLLKHVSDGDQITKPWSYIYAIATNVYREYVRKAVRLAEIDDNIEGPLDVSDGFVECARYCLRKLIDDKRRLIEQYYSDEGNREKLAGQTGVSVAALRLKIHRIKAELKECYRKCMHGQSG